MFFALRVIRTSATNYTITINRTVIIFIYFLLHSLPENNKVIFNLDGPQFVVERVQDVLTFEPGAAAVRQHVDYIAACGQVGMVP